MKSIPFCKPLSVVCGAQTTLLELNLAANFNFHASACAPQTEVKKILTPDSDS